MIVVLKLIAITCGLVIVAAVLLFDVGQCLAHWDCSSRARSMGLRYAYTTAQGCLVDFHGQWMRIEAVGV